MFWSASYSTSVVCTKTTIHLSVGESGGYLPWREYPPLLFTFTSVNNNNNIIIINNNNNNNSNNTMF